MPVAAGSESPTLACDRKPGRAEYEVEAFRLRANQAEGSLILRILNLIQEIFQLLPLFLSAPALFFFLLYLLFFLRFFPLRVFFFLLCPLRLLSFPVRVSLCLLRFLCFCRRFRILFFLQLLLFFALRRCFLSADSRFEPPVVCGLLFALRIKHFSPSAGFPVPRPKS